MVQVDYRQKLKELMLETLSDQQKWHNWFYWAVRPLSVPSKYIRGSRVVADCSKAAQYLCRWAGVPFDVTGFNWGAYGNSSSFCARCVHLNHPRELLTGDFVSSGINGRDHLAVVLHPGEDPVMWSFGHQGAPNTYNLSRDRRPKQYLRNPLPRFVPTPDDVLRSKTGYYAWLQWTLGEGSWKNKGKFNQKVRPDVGRVISPIWWKRRVQFLLNREKPNKERKNFNA